MANQLTSGRKFKLQPISLARMFWKRKLTFLTIWLAVAAAGTVFVHQMPAVYQADAVILVESQRIPEKFVAPTISTDLQDRLSSLSQQILSYERLLGVVEKFGLYPTGRQKLTNEQIVETMRGDISTRLEESWATRKGVARPSSFRISYQGQHPTTVAMVANQLANLFVEENLRARAVQAEGTFEFLETQVGEAKRRLEEQEAKLSDFKLRHNGELPEQGNALIAQIAQLQVRLQGAADAIARAEQNKALADTALASAQVSEASTAQLLKDLQTTDHETGTSIGSGSDSNRLKQELESLLEQYGEGHPDTRILRERLRKLQPEAVPTAPVIDGKPPASLGRLKPEKAFMMNENLIRGQERISSLRVQQELAAKQLDSLKAERTDLLSRMDQVEKGLSRLPLREQEVASIQRDYEMSKANYQSLFDKKIAAEMATEMEKRQKSERFTVVDAAQVPETPVKPNRPLLYGISCSLGFLLGLILAVGREWKNNTVLGEWELPKNTPLLGCVPDIVPLPKDSTVPAKPTGRVVRFSLRIAVICSAIVLALALAVTAAGVYFGRGGL